MTDYSGGYRVIRAGNYRFEIDAPDGVIECYSRKKVKRKGDILAGDVVTLDGAGDDVVIKSVEKRKNSLVRPAVANIDQIAMLVSPSPQPDFFLIDKLILNCHAQNIGVILCVNKTDIKDIYDEVARQYEKSVLAIVRINAKECNVSELLPLLKGKITCFAGQSAVGKSSLANALIGNNMFEVGELSEKIQRGKNTTTISSLVKISDATYIVDTPGFSLLDVFDVDADEIDLYYEEYVELSQKCRYHRCKHITEPDCEVKRQIEAGLLSKERYDRYIAISAALKNEKKY